MRHQTEIVQTAANICDERLDPRALPLRFTCADAAADHGHRSVTLDQERVLLMRRLGAVAMNVALPVASYRGIALRIIPGEHEKDDRVTVSLVHRDRDFDIPLYEASDDEDVIAEWRLWGTTLGLPLMIEGIDGHLVAADKRIGALTVDRPRPRRRHAMLTGRRPRFLTRRRMTHLPMVPFVHHAEREIFPG